MSDDKTKKDEERYPEITHPKYLPFRLKTPGEARANGAQIKDKWVNGRFGGEAMVDPEEVIKYLDDPITMNAGPLLLRRLAHEKQELVAKILTDPPSLASVVWMTSQALMCAGLNAAEISRIFSHVVIYADNMQPILDGTISDSELANRFRRH